jgi:tetratricopeptide (TPR) repeat protein
MSDFPVHAKSKQLTRGDQLRDTLARLEALVAQLGYALGEEALDIPPLFDEATAGLAELQAQGQGARGEAAQLETVSAGLRRKAGTFLREIGGASRLRDARNARQLNPAQWWWFLDQWLADRRRSQLRQLLQWTVVAALLLALLYFIYQRFLAPNPAIVASLEHQQKADWLAQAGDLAGALNETEQALAAIPRDPEQLVFKGVLQQTLGHDAAAEETFAVAEAQVGREGFLIARSRRYLSLGQAKAALADARAVIELNSNSAMGYLVLGQANEGAGNYAEAMDAYSRASTLAEAQNKLEIVAIARMQFGMLMQRLPTPTSAGP